jgi:hypothetical protein
MPTEKQCDQNNDADHAFMDTSKSSHKAFAHVLPHVENQKQNVRIWPRAKIQLCDKLVHGLHQFIDLLVFLRFIS